MHKVLWSIFVCLRVFFGSLTTLSRQQSVKNHNIFVFSWPKLKRGTVFPAWKHKSLSLNRHCLLWTHESENVTSRIHDVTPSDGNMKLKTYNGSLSSIFKFLWITVICIGRELISNCLLATFGTTLILIWAYPSLCFYSLYHSLCCHDINLNCAIWEQNNLNCVTGTIIYK